MRAEKKAQENEWVSTPNKVRRRLTTVLT